MKGSRHYTSHLLLKPKRTVKIRTTLFDLMETLNGEIKTGEEGFVIQILSDLINHGLLKAIRNPNVFRNIFY